MENGKEKIIEKKAQDRLNQIMGEVRSKSREFLNSGLENAKGLLHEKAKSMKKKAGEYSEKNVGEISDELRDYIRQHPLKSAAIAVGLGYVLATLLRPSRK